MARLLDKQLRDQVTREMRPDQRKDSGASAADPHKSGRAPRLALKQDDPKAGEGPKDTQSIPCGQVADQPSLRDRLHTPAHMLGCGMPHRVHSS